MKLGPHHQGDHLNSSCHAATHSMLVQQKLRIGPHDDHFSSKCCVSAEFGVPDGSARRCVVDEYEQAAIAAEGMSPG